MLIFLVLLIKMATDPLFLGFDLSTQQMKALAIDSKMNIVEETSVNFEKDLPEFRTVGGVHKDSNNLTVTAPVHMWIKSCDLVLERLKAKGFHFGSVACISGTGQQHGSVYWRNGAREILKNLKPGQSIFEQIKVPSPRGI